jgi:hypothetical protein
MIPKLAANLLHFNVQRVAAAVQTQTTQTLRNVLQFHQPQVQAQAQSVASASSASSTSASASLGCGWNNAAGTGAGPGGAKFNAGGRFYNAFQVSGALSLSRVLARSPSLDNRVTSDVAPISSDVTTTTDWSLGRAAWRRTHSAQRSVRRALPVLSRHSFIRTRHHDY